MVTAAAMVVSAPIAVGVWAADKVGLIDLPKEVGKSESLDDTSTAQQVESVVTIAEESIEPYIREGKNLERDYKRYINDYFDELLSGLKEDSAIADSFGLKRLKRIQRELIEDIDGALTEPVIARMSLDNDDYREILKLPRGGEKKKRIDQYARRVLMGAKENLSDTVQEVLYRQADEIDVFLRKYVDSQEQETKRLQDMFAKWEEDMQADDFNSEQAQLLPKTKLYAIDEMKRIMAA